MIENDKSKLRELYGNLVNDNYDMPDFDTFERDMADDAKMRELYDNIKSDNYDVPDYNTFRGDMGYGSPTQPQQPTTPAQQGERSPYQMAQSNTPTYDYGGQMPPAQRPTKSKATSKPTQTAEAQPLGPEKFAKQMQFEQRVRQSVPSPEAMMQDFSQRMENIRKGNQPFGSASEQRYNPETGKMETVYITKSGEEVSTPMEQQRINREVGDPVGSELREAYAERDRLNKEIDRRTREVDKANEPSFAQMLAASEGGGYNPVFAARSEDPELSMLWTAKRKNEERIKTLEREGKNEGFFRTLGKTLFSLDNLDFGLFDLIDAGNMMAYGDKKLKGSLGEAQESMMENTYRANVAQQQYGENDTFWQRAGELTGNAIPFVAEFALTGGYSGLTQAGTKAGSKMAAKYATGKVGQWVIKNTGTLVGDMAAGFAMANTTGGMKTAADIINRHQGQLVKDEDGDYVFDGGKSWGRSIYEGEMANTLEYYTEKLGVHLDGAGKVVGGWLGKGMERMGAGRVSELFNRITGSEWAKITGQVLRKGGVQDYPSEVVEEEANILLNSLLVGDNKFSDFVDGKTQADIWGGMMLSIGFMQSPGMVGGGYQTAQYYRYKHKTDMSDRVASTRLTPERWEPWRERIDNTTNEDMRDVISDIIGSQELQDEEKKAAINYVGNLMQMRGYNLRTTADAKDKINGTEAVDEVADADNESYQNGYEADEQSRRDIAIEYSMKPDDEVRAVAVDGVRQRIEDDADNEAEGWREEGRKMMHSDGSMRPAVLKVKNENGDDTEVYIVSGEVVMTADGTMVDRDRTLEANGGSTSIVIYDPATGERRMIDPTSDMGVLSLGEPTSAEDFEYEVQRRRDEYVQRMLDEAQGTVRVELGQSLTMPDGREGTVMAISPDGESFTVVANDGSGEVRMERSDLQQVADAASIADYQARHQEQVQAPEAEQVEGEEVVEEQEGLVEGAPAEFIPDMEITILDDEGNKHPATVLGRVRHEGGQFVPDENGATVEYMVDGQVKHDWIKTLKEKTVSHVENLAAPVEETEVSVAPNGDTLDEHSPAPATATDTPQHVQGVQGPDSGGKDTNIPQTEQENNSVDVQSNVSQRIPLKKVRVKRDLLDENGNPVKDKSGRKKKVVVEEEQEDWYATTEQDAYEYLYNDAVSEGLDVKDADAIVKLQREHAEKELADIKKKPKQYAGSVMETLRLSKAREAELAEAQRHVDYWNNVKKIRDGVRNAEAAEQAERDRVAHDAAVQEEAARQAEELAKREEQAALGSNAVAPQIVEKWTASPKVEGVENEITLANGEKVKGHYMLVESGAATPSHNPNMEFARNEGFPIDENGQTVNDRDYERDQEAQRITRQMADSYDSRAIQNVPVVSQEGIVLSGNGRTMAGELAAQQGTDGAYIEHLKKYPQQFGFTPEQVEGMQHPRVVFVADEDMPYTTDTFAKFNQQDMKSQSRTEQSVKMGKTVDDSTFGRIIRSINGFDSLADFYNDPVAATNAIGELHSAGAINTMQLAEMMDGEKVSGNGRQMLENMLIGKAFESNPDAIRQLAEFPAMRQSIVSALAEIANNIHLGEEFSLESELAQAINLAYQARKNGVKAGENVSWFARQQSLFPFDTGETVADYTNATVLMLADELNSASVNGLKKCLALYNRNAAEAAAGQYDIFSGGIKSKQDIINDALNVLNYGTEQEQQAALAAAVEQRKQGVQQDGVAGPGEAGDAGAAAGQGDLAQTEVNAPSSADKEKVASAIASAESEVNTNPTEGQKEAGNYKKGHLKLDGYDITIEQPKGSIRRGTDDNGKQWEQEMHNTYGYIRGTEGVDGDHIDVFLSDDPTSGDVFVVDQVNPQTGEFDEHKVMYGFPDTESAKAAYLSNYEEGWQGCGAITPVSKEEFKKWIESSHRKTKPFSEYASVKTKGDVLLGENQAEEYKAPAKEEGEDVIAYAQRVAETHKAYEEKQRHRQEIDDATARVADAVVSGEREAIENASAELEKLTQTDDKVEGEKEHRAGYVVEKPTAEQKALRDELIEVMRGEGGMEVITDEEGQRVLDEYRDRAKLLKTYHGSGADFDAFDHSHMGEGEGAQAYGWGTYVTEVEGIGKAYANSYGRASVMMNGVPIRQVLSNEDYWDRQFANFVTGYERTLDELKESIGHVYIDGRIAGSRSKRVRELQKQKDRLLSAIDNGEVTIDRGGAEPILYTVDIPDDNGSNYLEWDKPIGEENIGSLLVELEKHLLTNDDYYKEQYKGHENDLIANLESDFKSTDEGRFVYENLAGRLGSDKAASEFLHSMGYVGIKYPAEYRSGGRSDGAKNYVIFDEGDLKITDKTRFFRTEDGEVYGFTMGGKIYIDPSVATAETPIHEYTHLWTKALRKANPEAWERLKEEMRQQEGLMDYVRSKYPELTNEDELMDEVFAHYSGQRGAERLESDMREAMAQEPDLTLKAQVALVFHKLREVMQKFWTMARDLFAGKVEGLEGMTAEDFADMALGDLLKGFDPRGAARERTATEQSAKEARDREYLAAVERGDMETAQQMVSEAALEAMPDTKIVDENGTPRVVYHQTANVFTVFNPRHHGAGTNDNQMPFGVYLKPTDSNIGVQGERQMALYADIKNPLHFADRTALSSWLVENVPGYREAKAEYERIDREYENRFDALYSADGEKYDDLWERWHNGEISEEEYQRAIDDVDSTQPLLDEWHEAENRQSAVMKNLVDDYMRASEYDGIVIDNDEGSFGRTTSTILALDPEQAKSAEGVTYDDNGNVIPLSQRFDKRNADIRYQKGDNVAYMERVTELLLRLASGNEASAAQKMSAYRAIGGNLASLRKAMSLQKEFDKGTVQRVTDLATSLISHGMLDNMKASEVSRLLSAVKNSTAKENIKGGLNTVMDILIDSQLRRAEEMLHKLESVRGSKVDAKGVQVQGQLDIAGQRMVDTFKKARGWQKESVEEKMANAEERMGSEDTVEAEEAALEFAGLQMAHDYIEKIQASEMAEEDLYKSIRNEEKKVYTYSEEPVLDADGNPMLKKDGEPMKRTVRHTKPEFKAPMSEENKRIKQQVKEFVASTEEAIRHGKTERLQDYMELIGRLSGSMRESMANAKAWKEEQKERVREIQHNANSDMEGRPSNEHHADTETFLKRVNNLAANTIFAPLRTFTEMLRLFGSKSAGGEGYLFNRFVRGLIDARQKEIRGVRSKFAVLDSKAREVFGDGVKNWADVMNEAAKGDKISVDFWDGGKMRPHKLHQGNLMYIYMVDKMSDGRMKLRHMGVTEEAVEAIAKKLDPRLKELADWLQEEFLVDTRKEYNETHKRMFGASMAEVENYFPLKILANARVEKPEDLDAPERNEGISTQTGSIIKRTANTLALDLMGADALHVILDHVAQMEHWNAFAEYNRDLNTLRTYKRFRNQVQNMTTIYGNGEKLWKKFNEVCQIAVGAYHPKQHDFDKGALEFAQGVTAAKVSFRVNTALKQLLSLPAYLPYVNAKGFYRSVANNIKGKETSFQWCLEHLPMFEERWKSKVSGDPRLAKTAMDWQSSRANFVQKVSRAGMLPNAFIDALTVSIGAHAVYETRLNEYLKAGYQREAAEKRAIQDAEIAYNETQQSSEGGFLSTIQSDRTWWSVMFTVFRNSSMAYQRQLHGALRNLGHNLTKAQRAATLAFETKQMVRDGVPEERAEAAAKSRIGREMRKNALAVATFGYIVQFAWNLGGKMWYLLFGDDDDEKEEMWDDIWVQSMFGGVEGLTGGDVMSEFGRQIVRGDYNPRSLDKDMPLSSDLALMIQKLGKGKGGETLNDMVNLLVQAGIGVNPQSLTDAVLATVDACGGDLEFSHEALLFATRVLQVPQSQIKKLYFDEIGMSGEDAQKMSVEELVERYARYQVKRGRLVTPWEWDDEELLKKERDKGMTAVRERMEHMDTEELLNMRYGGKGMKDEVKKALKKRLKNEPPGSDEVNEAYERYETLFKELDAQDKEAREINQKDPETATEMWYEIKNDKKKYNVFSWWRPMDSMYDDMARQLVKSKSTGEYNRDMEKLTEFRTKMVEMLGMDEDDEKAVKMRQDLFNMYFDYMYYYTDSPKNYNAKDLSW